jgi:hypothetical protein
MKYSRVQNRVEEITHVKYKKISGTMILACKIKTGGFNL